MMSHYGRPDAKHIAIMLTDSDFTTNFERTAYEAAAAKSQGISIFVLGALRLCLFKFAECNCQVYVKYYTNNYTSV